MHTEILRYIIDELPDPAYPQYQLVAGGDVRSAIWRDWERFARVVSNYPPESLIVSITGVYIPMPENFDIQSRLRFYLSVSAMNGETLDSFRLLIEQGPLSKFYKFKKQDDYEKTPPDFAAEYEIIRRVDTLKPLHGPEYNDRIPELYYLIQPFQPVEDNDHLVLDGVFRNTKEPVALILSIEPVDVTREFNAHTKYLAQLHSINRTWDSDDFDYESPSEQLADVHSSFRSGIKRIKPLRYYDPLADDALRIQQRFHDDLKNPHVLFNFVVRAETNPIAKLIASVSAESAFAEGSYRIIDRKSSTEGLKGIDRCYPQFNRLSNLATVREIKGIFRLPVASFSSLSCMRKNTDPPNRPQTDRIVLGHDQELLQSNGTQDVFRAARGPALNDIPKHGFICGVSGSGKTTSVQNILLQLHGHGIPFLILEPVKTEYRLLKTLRACSDQNARSLAENLEVYTPGNDAISPFRYNPPPTMQRNRA